MNHNSNRRSMKDARKNKKTKKQPTVGRPKTPEGKRLRQLLDELHGKEQHESARRAEDILRLIRQRQAQEGLAQGIDRIVRQQARTASALFLRKFFDGINGIK